MLPDGTELHGRYRIERTIARGRSSVIYQARHDVLHERQVAIKEIAISPDESESRRLEIEHFQRQATLLASLDHTSLVHVYDYFEEAGGYYVVMEFLQGNTLQALVEETGRLSVSSVYQWAIQMCEALEYLHGRAPPVLYRDLKPSNVMVDARGRIHLLDFGLSRTADVDGFTGTLIRGQGALGYAPAEQFGGHTDTRSDIYALGAILYSMLGRRAPPSSIDLLAGNASLTPLTEMNAQVTVELDRYIRGMMAPTRSDRPQDVKEVRRLFEQLTRPVRPSSVVEYREASVAAQATPAERAEPRKKVWFDSFTQWALRQRPMRILPGKPRAEPSDRIPRMRWQERPELIREQALSPESKWVAHLHDLDMKPQAPQRKEWANAPLWLWRLAIAVGICGLVLPYYMPTFRVGFMSLLSLPALLFCKLLTSMFGKAGTPALLTTLLQLGVPIACGIVFYLRNRLFAVTMAAVWMSLNLLELAVILRYSQVMYLPFAQDFARSWMALQGSTADPALSYAPYVLRAFGLVLLVCALIAMLCTVPAAARPARSE